MVQGTLTVTSRQFHKLVCIDIKSFQDRPSDNIRCALLLPEHGNTPTFIWLPVHVKNTRKGDGAGFHNVCQVSFTDREDGSTMPDLAHVSTLLDRYSECLLKTPGEHCEKKLQQFTQQVNIVVQALTDLNLSPTELKTVRDQKRSILHAERKLCGGRPLDGALLKEIIKEHLCGGSKVSQEKKENEARAERGASKGDSQQERAGEEVKEDEHVREGEKENGDAGDNQEQN